MLRARKDQRARRVARRSSVTATLLAMVVLAIFGPEPLTSGAVTVPSVRVSSLTVPSVHVPSVHTPVGSTPPVSRPHVSTPPVSTPALRTPSPSAVRPTASSSVAGGQGIPALPSLPASTPGAAKNAVGQSGYGTRGTTSPAAGGYSADSRRPGSSPSAVADRRLQNIVIRFSRCLGALPPQGQRILLLRSGVGRLRHYSRGAVAQMLHISAAREAEVEHSALVELQASARHGNCGGTSLAVIQVPAQNRLVSVDPILMSGNQVLSSARTLGGASGTSRSRRTSGPGRGDPVIQEAALGRVPTSDSTAGPWVFGVFVLLGALALLSAAGRRLSEGRPLAMAASVGVLPVIEPAGHGALGPNDGPITAPASDQSTAAQAPAFPTPSHGTAPQVLQRAPGQQRKPYEPGSARAPTPASGRAYSRMSWLRTHGSQIALVLTVVTGGALRFMARHRGGRRR